MYRAGDVRVEDVPDARLIEPTDALVRVTRAAICGSDLWPYKSMPLDDTGRRMGHEFTGVVDAVGCDVSTIKAGDLVTLSLPLVGRQLRVLPRGPAERVPVRRQVRL
jgi:threonine dehydrogenase-like Zn-dependent dehydrogenase